MKLLAILLLACVVAGCTAPCVDRDPTEAEAIRATHGKPPPFGCFGDGVVPCCSPEGRISWCCSSEVQP